MAIDSESLVLLGPAAGDVSFSAPITDAFVPSSEGGDATDWDSPNFSFRSPNIDDIDG